MMKFTPSLKLGLIATGVALIVLVLAGYMYENNYYQARLGYPQNRTYSGGPLFGNFNDASKAIPDCDADQTSTAIGPRRTYWLIPNEQRASGGWDSMSGWYECESPCRWNEHAYDVYGCQQPRPGPSPEPSLKSQEETFCKLVSAYSDGDPYSYCMDAYKKNPQTSQTVSCQVNCAKQNSNMTGLAQCMQSNNCA